MKFHEDWTKKVDFFDPDFRYILQKYIAQQFSSYTLSNGPFDQVL